MIGIRHALERGRGGQPVGTALLGTVMAVAALCATAVFGGSLTHLISSPALYGDGHLPGGDRDIMLGVATMRATGARLGGPSG